MKEPRLGSSLTPVVNCGDDDQIGTLYWLSQMGDLRIDQDRLSKAEEFYRTVLDRCRRINGNNHTNTITAVGNLAEAFEAQVRWQEAEPLRRSLVEVAIRRGQGDEIIVSHYKSDWAVKLIHQYRHAEAKELLVQCVTVYCEEESPNCRRRWNAQSPLGEAIALDPERLEEAERLMCDAAKSITPPSNASVTSLRRVAQSRLRPVKYCESVGEKQKAAEWRLKVDPAE
ncbi:MAG: hypothetical protein DHS20C16_23400 [Phycisphaerae bacterium]|nr:MAG: hypothetical protein DHS20C16_23400 [Phycisphaerae bacterium]